MAGSFSFMFKSSKPKLLWRRIRIVAAWIVLPSILSMWIADRSLTTKFGAGPWPSWVARPKELELILMWRNYSLLLVLAMSFISMPRWQSIVGIVAALVFVFYLSGQ